MGPRDWIQSAQFEVKDKPAEALVLGQGADHQMPCSAVCKRSITSCRNQLVRYFLRHSSEQKNVFLARIAVSSGI